MVQLDDAFLDSVGLADLAPEDRSSLLTLVASEFETRVGTRISWLMTDEAIAEFTEALESGADGLAQDVLTRHVPHRSEIVTAEWERLRQELAARAPEILVRLPPLRPPRGAR